MTSRFFVSIVSHGHFDFIKRNQCLPEISKLPMVTVAIRDNLGEKSLQIFCEENSIDYLHEKNKKLGFGENNNQVYCYFKNTLNMGNTDFFLVINPDVYISKDSFVDFVSEVESAASGFYTIDLFKDFDFVSRDPFIRRFPSMKDFFKSFIFSVNDSILDRSGPVTAIDWCAGSFMCFSSEIYYRVRGFDESYFMYCEDIDICYRLKKIGVSLSYIDKIKAVHPAQFDNRKVFSKHFFWHIKSVFRFLVLKNMPKMAYFLRLKFRSSINR